MKSKRLSIIAFSFIASALTIGVLTSTVRGQAGKNAESKIISVQKSHSSENTADIAKEKYAQVIDKHNDVINRFNSNYSVDYKIASPDETSAEIDVLIAEYDTILAMTEEEFYDHLISLYGIDSKEDPLYIENLPFYDDGNTKISGEVEYNERSADREDFDQKGYEIELLK